MNNRELAGALRRAGFKPIRIACRNHRERVARLFCPACRHPVCLGCAALKRRRLRCDACAAARPPRLGRMLRSPMGASAAAILVMTILAVSFQDAFRTENSSVPYSPAMEPPAVARAMRTLDQAYRLRVAAEQYAQHGLPGRSERLAGHADRVYGRFEALYPKDDPDVPVTYAVAASRYARAIMTDSESMLESVATEFAGEPPGLLARVRIIRRRVESGETVELEQILHRMDKELAGLGGFGEGLARAFADQKVGARRMAIEELTGARFSPSEAKLEVAYLLGRVCEAGGRKEEAIEFYGKVLASALTTADWFEDARARLNRLQPGDETMKIRRIED